jgi:transcriptional regulator with XRE-family HTH domain
MITRIREVRRARGMTLDDVAKACAPPTTPQTIGRLETGMRTVSVGWLKIAMTVTASSGDYRAGDEIWLERLEPEDFAQALNRDILVPRPAGRFLFGRLIGREEGKLHLLPPGSGGRQSVVADPPWAAVAVRLVRAL